MIGVGDGGDAPPYYRITTADFPDMAACEAALGSPTGKEATADYARIAPPGSRILVTEIDG